MRNCQIITVTYLLLVLVSPFPPLILEELSENSKVSLRRFNPCSDYKVGTEMRIKGEFPLASKGLLITLVFINVRIA